MGEIEKREGRNQNGVKNISDIYRTFGGDHYYCWDDFDIDARLAAYRAAGLRVRRVSGWLFMHHADIASAGRVDEARRATALNPLPNPVEGGN